MNVFWTVMVRKRKEKRGGEEKKGRGGKGGNIITGLLYYYFRVYNKYGVLQTASIGAAQIIRGETREPEALSPLSGPPDYGEGI